MSARPKIAKAIIPAAGFGTRMLPATKAIPKEMLPVAGKPLIQYAVEEAAAAGVKTVILVIRKHKSLIQAHFARDLVLESLLRDRQLEAVAGLVRSLSEMAHLQYVEQEKPLGLAHAISCAQSLVGDEPFVVLLPDVVIVHEESVTSQLIRAHERLGGSIVAIREVEAQDVKHHGIVQVERPIVLSFDETARIIGLVEKPSLLEAPSRFGVFGRYLLTPGIWHAISQTIPDARGEVQLTDALNLLCQASLVSGLCFEGRHYDAGDRVGYLRANLDLTLRDPQFRQPVLDFLAFSDLPH